MVSVRKSFRGSSPKSFGLLLRVALAALLLGPGLVSRALADDVKAETKSQDQPKSEDKPIDYYVRNRSYRTVPETDPSRYVRNLAKTGIEAFKDLDWLDVGLEHRIRYEHREYDHRRTPQQGDDDPVLLRTRAYLGLKKKLDPFRFVVEFQDSRKYNGRYPRDNRDVNEFDLIQLYGELYFKDLLGKNRPLSIRAGRQHMELLDRRLIANNEFRNTTNNFQGARIKLGQQSNDWEADLLALQPIERLLYDFDRRFDEQWLFGVVTSWRRWSKIATLQPYYLGFRQDGKDDKKDIDIHSAGLRSYGIVAGTGLDWDADVVYQWGRSNGSEQHEAWASALELGYTFESFAWKPRLSAFHGFGTGDDDPGDKSNNRFNPLFGFNQPWSRNDYFSWDNLNTPKVRLELVPTKDLQVDLGLNAFWLASKTDSWGRANLRDKEGKSGSFLGHEYDIRVRYKLTPRIAADVSYAYFASGDFTRKLGKPKDANFIYAQLSFNAFE